MLEIFVYQTSDGTALQIQISFVNEFYYLTLSCYGTEFGCNSLLLNPNVIVIEDSITIEWLRMKDVVFILTIEHQNQHIINSEQGRRKHQLM